MFCSICRNEASFICNCNALALCSSHLGDHMKEKCGGQFDHIDQTLDPQDNSFLKQRIIQTSEKILKLIKKIQKQSKILILKIENESNQLILSLTNHLSNMQKFSERKKFSKSELPSLKTFLKAHHEIHLPDFKSIEDQITICFRQEIIKKAKEEDWQTFSLRNFFAGHQGGLWCGVIDYSRDLLITGSYDSIIRIYDLQKHSLITTIEGHKSDIRCLALAGENFLSGSNDKTIKIWETDSSFHKGELLGHRGCVYSIQVFQLNTKVLSASRAKEIICWDLKLRTQIFRVETENVCWCLKVIKDSSLAFVSVGTSVKILKIFNAEIGGFIDGFERSVKCFEVTDDEKFIVCGNFDGSVKVFEVDHVENSFELGSHKKLVNSLVFINNDLNLVSGSDDQTVVFWDFLNRTIEMKFEVHYSFIHAVLPYKNYCISLSEDALILFNNLSTFETEEKLQTNYYSSFIQNALSDVFYVKNNSVFYWNSQNNQEKLILKEKKEISCISLSRNNSFIAVGLITTQENIAFWDVNNSALISRLQGHQSDVKGIIFISNDSKILSSSSDKTVKIWDFSSFSLLKVIHYNSGNLKNWVYLDSRQIAVCSSGRNLVIFDLNKYTADSELTSNSNIIKFVEVTFDEKYIVSSDIYTGILVWNVSEKKIEFSFKSLEESREFIGFYPQLRMKLEKYLF